MPIINGQKGAYPQPGRFGRTEAGAFADKAWEGTLAEIYQMAAVCEYNAGLWQVLESYTGAKHRIEAHFPIDFNTTEAPVNGWELFAEEVEKDVLEADIAAIDGIPDDELTVLRGILDGGVDPDAPSPLGLLSNPTAILLYGQIVKGLRSIRVAVPHLRHTQTVSFLWTVGAALTNVGRIISTASLLSLEAVPGNLLFNLPTGSSSRTGLSYGWFKKFPTVRESTGHRTQIEQEWEYGLWSTLIYGNPL